jgi:hypothetical protein
MLDLIWDVWQQHRIGELEQKAQASGAQVADVNERVRGTGQNLERLVLTSAAMWSLIKERTGLTDQDLVARVRKMEGEQEEGWGQAVKCAKCGRTVPARKARCMYCGEERGEAGAFSGR